MYTSIALDHMCHVTTDRAVTLGTSGKFRLMLGLFLDIF
jgi:hypothetical protein